MSDPAPIGDYGLIGDTRSAALVGTDGSIDWCCLPAFDSPPVFGRLVGGDEAGSWSIAPEEPAHAVERSYVGRTATLETRWTFSRSTLTLRDCMIACVSGRALPQSVLVRTIRCDGAPTRVRTTWSPRFGYERAHARAIRRHGRGLVVVGGDVALAFTTDIAGTPRPDEASAFGLEPGQQVTFVLTATSATPAVLVPPAVARSAVADDERAWEEWTARIPRLRVAPDAVVRSLLTMRLLDYSPSGAPVAAPTTSLPERIGGTRNWDYRFSWPRDASIGIGGFLALGEPREAKAFLRWLLHAGRLARPELPVLLRLTGLPGPPERQLADWPGYAGSRPVRVGNAASEQHQLDVYGWVLDAAWLLDHSGHLDGEAWRAVASFADHVARVWREPDSGVWEHRREPRHYVHSKLMAWLALDRVLRMAARRRVRARRVARWRDERDALAAEIRERGFDAELGAYTASYGAKTFDAAVLLIAILEFEPPGSPRVTRTVDAIRRHLSAGGPFVYRYQCDDGDHPEEGAFLPCSFWLVQALARTDRVAEAEAMFHELVTCGGALGLYAEEIDPATRAHLGNFPQALTHAALVQAALALDEAPLIERPERWGKPAVGKDSPR